MKVIKVGYTFYKRRVVIALKIPKTSATELYSPLSTIFAGALTTCLAQGLMRQDIVSFTGRRVVLFILYIYMGRHTHAHSFWEAFFAFCFCFPVYSSTHLLIFVTRPVALERSLSLPTDSNFCHRLLVRWLP